MMGLTMNDRDTQERGTRADRIRALLTEAFAPVQLELEDDSARHAGHAGTKGVTGGETHFNVRLVSAAFTGQSRVARSRLVHQALAPEFSNGLHALSLVLKSPTEAQ